MHQNFIADFKNSCFSGKIATEARAIKNGAFVEKSCKL